jgi:hypothetical protein
VSDGAVQMIDENGKPIGPPVECGEHDPRSIASVLVKQRFDEEKGDADFDRPLSFPPDSVA